MIRVNNIIFIIFFLILLFISGFRFDVGIDWLNYTLIFTENSVDERMEKAVIFIHDKLHSFGLTNGRYWLWVMATITIFFFIVSIKKISISPFLSLLFFVLLEHYFSSLNAVRQYAAIAICVYSWQYILKRQFFVYIIWVTIAYNFHSTAIVMYPVYFIYNIHIPKKYLISIGIICLISSFFISNQFANIAGLFEKYQVYEDSSFIMSKGNIKSYIKCVYPFILLVLASKKYKYIENNDDYRTIFNISYIGMLIIFIAPSTELLIRICWYFSIAYIFLIPILTKNFRKSMGIIFILFSIIYCCSYLYFILLSNPEYNIWPFDLNYYLSKRALLKITFIVTSVSSLAILILDQAGKKLP